MVDTHQTPKVEVFSAARSGLRSLTLGITQDTLSTLCLFKILSHCFSGWLNSICQNNELLIVLGVLVLRVVPDPLFYDSFVASVSW